MLHIWDGDGSARAGCRIESRQTKKKLVGLAELTPALISRSSGIIRCTVVNFVRHVLFVSGTACDAFTLHLQSIDSARPHYLRSVRVIVTSFFAT